MLMQPQKSLVPTVKYSPLMATTTTLGTTTGTINMTIRAGATTVRLVILHDRIL
jgi:hypothetical protein